MFELNEKGNRIVTGKYQNGTEEGFESLVVTTNGGKMIIYSDRNDIRSIRKSRWGLLKVYKNHKNSWTDKRGQNHDPHGCLRKGLVEYQN